MRERKTIRKEDVGKYFLVRVYRNDFPDMADQDYNDKHYCLVLPEGAVYCQFLQTCEKYYVKDGDWPIGVGKRHPNLYADISRFYGLGETILDSHHVVNILMLRNEDELPPDIAILFDKLAQDR